MVNIYSIISIIITCCISIILPIVLIIYFKRKYNASLLYFFVGIIIFTVFQLIIRIPMLEKISGQFWFTAYIASNKYFYGLFLALTAALFEEIGRFLAFRFMLLDNRKWENGIAFGIGHGGIEAVTIVGINYLFLLIISLNINFDILEQLVTKIPQLSYFNSVLLDVSPVLLLFAGIERLFAVCIHIGLSVIVLDTVRRGKIKGVFIAIFLHTLINFSAVLLSNNIYVIESVIAVAGIISLLYVRRKKNFWKFIL